MPAFGEDTDIHHRMILGDSLQVMASLAEREALSEGARLKPT
jgi:hypothetical protein